MFFLGQAELGGRVHGTYFHSSWTIHCRIDGGESISIAGRVPVAPKLVVSPSCIGLVNLCWKSQTELYNCIHNKRPVSVHIFFLA
jgi:hypothetical protein